jgi:hypothetical protein
MNKNITNKKNKDVVNFNNKKQHHGYHELYLDKTLFVRGNLYLDKTLFVRGNYKNDGEIGYLEWHDGKITTYYIK